ncbi:MAG: HupE/UreJ family protein [Methylophilus sp.]|nr:HupE/UreJ family protein [Methylophilus sp.]
MKEKLLLAATLMVSTSTVFAHPGHGLETAYAGFIHPMTGWDHLLVMLAVGLWAAKLGGKARWQLPLTFVSVMAVGIILGAAGIHFSGVETAIAASVMAMGVLLILSLPMHKTLQLSITAIFALFHGMAHGVELTLHQSYTALGGMLLATALLHGVGFQLGSQRVKWAKCMQNCIACLMLIAGSYLFLG